jgi:hypothetical protein
MWQQWNLFRTRESEVIESLRSLPEEYVVLHDLIVPECRDRVDHVVVGPNGVFVIETTDCAGEVKCERHDWAVGRRRIASLSRQAEIKAAALRNSLVAATYEGEKRIPVVPAVLVFTNPEAEISVREPAVPAMRAGDVAAFILHYRVAEIGPKNRAAMVQDLVSFQSNKNHRRGFFGIRRGPAPAPKFSRAPAAHESRSGLRFAPDGGRDRQQGGRRNIDRLPDFSARG